MIKVVDLQVLVKAWSEQPEFTPPSLDKIQYRCGQQFLALVFEKEHCFAGFKLGYALNENQFYSWVGGVKPQFRGQGIAKALLDYQENWCRENRFREIQVKSMNRFKPMLHMLIANDYQIVGVQQKESQQQEKILFKKILND